MGETIAGFILAKGYYALSDYERAGTRRLPFALREYVRGGVEDDAALRANRSAFTRLTLVPHVLTGQVPGTRTTLFGRDHAAPFGIAPMGALGLGRFDGDVEAALGAQAAGIPFMLSGAAITPMERVVEAAPASWFQAYLGGELADKLALVERARVAGFPVLVVTVDVPVVGNRENNLRAGFSIPIRPSLRLALDAARHPRWTIGTLGRTLLHGVPRMEHYRHGVRSPVFAGAGAVAQSRAISRPATWDDVARVRDRWPGTLVLKGLLHPADAERAVTIGCDGVILSNHGGRQLDAAPAPLDLLPDIAAQVGDRLVVMLDGGVRRGGDVLKALALGVRFVFVGRPMFFALAVGGRDAVAHAAMLLRQEIERDLTLLGCARLQDVTEHLSSSLAFPVSQYTVTPR